MKMWKQLVAAVAVTSAQVFAPVVAEAVTITPPDTGDNTRPIAQSGLEMALRAAAEEAKDAGWGQAAIVQDSAGDAVDALRKLREVKKTESES